LESAFRKLWIDTLKAQVALRKFICESLAEEFEDPSSTSARKARLAYLWDGAIKDTNLIQLLMDLLERQEREENGEPSFVVATR
jgi:hypothetical protein